MTSEATKEKVRELVKESMEKVIGESVSMRLEAFEKKGKKDESEEDTDADDKSDDSDDKGGEKELKEGEEEDPDRSSEEPLEEALKVVAMGPHMNQRGPGDEFDVKDLRELTRIAKTGKYGWFMVTNRRGDETEYTVENGKLVLM